MPDLDDSFLDDLSLVLLVVISRFLILEECLPLLLLFLLSRLTLLVFFLICDHGQDTGLLHLI